MRLPTFLVIAAATAVVAACGASGPDEPQGSPQPVHPLGTSVDDGRAAFDDLSSGALSTEGRSVNVSVAGQIAHPPALGATLGAPGPGPVQVALVDAYLGAVRGAPPACRLRAEVLAAIAQVESGSAGGQSLSGHRVVPGVYGPLLSGGRLARVPDTDGGLLDGNTQWDRAVGPMQFVPSAWADFGTDGDGDGKADPQNVYDSVVSASLYLCAGGRDLAQPTELAAAIVSYNHSGPYLLAVLDWIDYFDKHGLVAIGPVSAPVLSHGPTAPTKSEPATVTPEVVTRAVAKAATLPVAPPPPPPAILPGTRTPAPRPSTSRPPGPTTSPSTSPQPTTTTPDPTTTTPDPTTTTPDPTTTTPDPTTTTPDPTTTTPDPTTTTPDPTTTTPDPTTTTPDPTTTTPDPTTTTPDPTTTTPDPTTTTSDPTTTTPDPTTTTSDPTTTTPDPTTTT
ncbi:lytic murein transglycosylase [Phycicoccus sp. Soil748]|uniref:lytic murein transglycosylase n=1 Tax=Phycicoccus sp. Soil748 TaxID=1736397 RepID=UPI00070244B8|nr:lytic murein transglycosylase [Phycicoccus sp. Soil748]KRE55392.1 hypothetical protein ASG70_08430 [Phycicoccus sp. Soil748]